MSRVILWQSLEPREKELRWDNNVDPAWSYDQKVGFGKKLNDSIIDLQKKGYMRDDISYDFVRIYLLTFKYGITNTYNVNDESIDENSWESYLDALIDCVYRSLKA